MKLKFMLLWAAAAVSMQSYAQTWVPDSVSQGIGAPPSVPSYPTDVYYSMKTGKVKEIANHDWHLAFDMTLPSGPNSYVGIIANHVQGKVSVYSTHKAGSSNFVSYSAADTLPGLTNQLYNTDTNWHWGALNANRDMSNLFDFGWGKYDITSHTVLGDSIYIVKAGDAAYKLMVQKYIGSPVDSISYIFRIAQLDNTGDGIVRIYRNSQKAENFVYYNMQTQTFTSREPVATDWDIVFTRYIEYIQAGPGPKQPYPVTGVLSNLGVKVAEARKLNPDTVTYKNYTYTKYMNEIGSDWKVFNQSTFTYELDTVSYFVRSANSQEYYQIKFTRFDGGSTGKVVFAKRMIAPTSVNDITNNVSTYALAPNPAVNEASLMADVKEAGEARLLVTDMTGKIMQQNVVSLVKGLNAFSINTAAYASGMYFVTLTNGSWKVAEKMLVQH